jgi:hypothetical protein
LQATSELFEDFPRPCKMMMSGRGVALRFGVLLNVFLIGSFWATHQLQDRHETLVDYTLLASIALFIAIRYLFKRPAAIAYSALPSVAAIGMLLATSFYSFEKLSPGIALTSCWVGLVVSGVLFLAFGYKLARAPADSARSGIILTILIFLIVLMQPSEAFIAAATAQDVLPDEVLISFALTLILFILAARSLLSEWSRARIGVRLQVSQMAAWQVAHRLIIAYGLLVFLLAGLLIDIRT